MKKHLEQSEKYILLAVGVVALLPEVLPLLKEHVHPLVFAGLAFAGLAARYIGRRMK